MNELFWCLPLNEWISEKKISVTNAAKLFGYTRPHLSVILCHKKAYVINDDLYVNGEVKVKP